MLPLLIEGMQGLGDNLYQRAIIRELGEIYLQTPWPQLYVDLPVKCVRPVTRLRTQAKNASRRDLSWCARPSRANVKRWHYVNRDSSIVQSLLDEIGLKRDALNFSGPPVEPVSAEPYVLVRPATIRKEWRADSRNPRPEYIAQAVEALRGKYKIVSVADLKAGEEWPLEPLPYADEQYHAGMPIERLLSLVAGASAVVGGVGWLVPAAVAYKRPMFLIYGGWGKHNGPQRIFDRRMDTSEIHQAIPDQFCMCSTAAHDCNKTINNLDDHLERFLLRLAAR